MWKFSFFLDESYTTPNYVDFWAKNSQHFLTQEYLTYFEPVVQSFKQMSFGCPFLNPHLITNHTIIGVWLSWVTKLGPLTLEVVVRNLMDWYFGSQGKVEMEIFSC